jgi:hypothetical protein
MGSTWFSISSTWPKRCRSAATLAARCGSGAWKLARSDALPKVALSGGGVLMDTAAPRIVAATAAVISASTSSCWRHSRRNSRHAQRITARRAGAPPLSARARAGMGRSPTTVLMALPSFVIGHFRGTLPVLVLRGLT